MRQSIYDVTNLEKKTSLNFFEFIWTWLRVKLISIHHISPVPTPQEVEFSSFILIHFALIELQYHLLLNSITLLDTLVN